MSLVDDTDLNDTLSVCVLGSSSAGNSTLVQSGKSAFLVDCGFSPAYIAKQLRKLDLTLSDLTGVFITHTHGDHVNEWTVKKLIEEEVPIYCPPEIALHLQGRYRALARASHLGLLKCLRKNEIGLDGHLVRCFPVPHDSPGGCFGYSILSEARERTKKVTITTDIGRATDSAIRHMADSDIIVLESNHDVEMLENSGRPIWLKRRIREIGHLSNDESAWALLSVLDHSTSLPQTVMLAHVSQECNTNAIAVRCAEDALDRLGINSVTQ